LHKGWWKLKSENRQHEAKMQPFEGTDDAGVTLD